MSVPVLYLSDLDYNFIRRRFWEESTFFVPEMGQYRPFGFYFSLQSTLCDCVTRSASGRTSKMLVYLIAKIASFDFSH